MYSSFSSSRARLIASAAVCAALYAIVNAVTAFIRTPWGVGEFRPGVVIPAFFAITAGPLPAALGAGIGSFIGDMISLVPAGQSNFLWSIGAGLPGNFVGFLLLGYLYQKMKSWKGFVFGTTVGLFVGNLIAAFGVVLLGMFFLPPSTLNSFNGMNIGLASGIGIGLLLFWFGTMFPFVIILVPPLVRFLRPYASNLSIGREYPELSEGNRKLVWGWSILVSGLVLAALAVAILSGLAGVKAIVSSDGGSLFWIAIFIISAISVLVMGAFIPQIAPSQKIENKVAASKP